MSDDKIYCNIGPKDTPKTETTPGVEVSVKMSKEDQEKGNGLHAAPAHNWRHFNCCKFTMDEMGLLNLKLTILAVFCVILGTFLVAFEVQYFMTMEKCADTAKTIVEQQDTNTNLSIQATQLKDELHNIAKRLEMLHQQYDNATALTRTLEANLTETNEMLKKERVMNINITEKNIQLKAETAALQRQAKLCRDGWEYFRGSFYFFSPYKKTWAEGRNACVVMGGDLVVIDSAEEMDFLKDKGHEHYIGLTDGQAEGSWQWIDNTTLKDPTFWAPKQPDNLIMPGWDSAGEDCAIISEQWWYDIPCNRGYKSICEAKLSCVNDGMDGTYCNFSILR